MMRFEYGDPESSNVLIQMVDGRDQSMLESEAHTITRMAGEDFHLVALTVDNWNRDLSPWESPAVFGDEAFGGCAKETLSGVLAEVDDPGKKYCIGGYSLAGLFALWAAFQTDRFEGVAAASPSIWFPGFTDYMRDNPVHAGKVYLSLGDREEKTRNQVMASVGWCIRDGYSILREKGVVCTLEWNKGNHFKEADIRTAAAFAWLIKAKLT